MRVARGRRDATCGGLLPPLPPRSQTDQSRPKQEEGGGFGYGSQSALASVGREAADLSFRRAGRERRLTSPPGTDGAYPVQSMALPTGFGPVFWAYTLTVPIISMFFGIVVRMFYKEHEPAHFHAEYQGQQRKFDFDGNPTSGASSQARQ